MTNQKILIIEDDETLSGVLKYNFEKEGYQTLTAKDGLKAVEVARSEKPDLIILDIMLPKMDGLEVCRILRKEMTAPILMLTAKTEENDKVVGLEIGADDYMTKPFSMRELLARVKASFRRSEMLKKESGEESAASQIIRTSLFEIDLTRHKVSLAGSPLELSPKEFDLLVFLARNRGQVFNREILLSKVWGYDYSGDTRTVDVHVRWLREKIEKNPEAPKFIITVRGIGYKFEEPE